MPWLGPHVILLMETFEVPDEIAMQSSPVTVSLLSNLSRDAGSKHMAWFSVNFLKIKTKILKVRHQLQMLIL